MQDIYSLSGVSKQGHHQSFKREQAWLEKIPSYIGLMEEIREIHPGMGLRTMYEMTQPEGIGRDAFIVLGLQSGFRLQVVSNPTRTTFSMPSRRYPNLLLHREFTDVNQIWTSDITYFEYKEKYYYIVLIMDVYSRRIVGWHIADNMRAENNVKALQKALILRGIDNYHNTLIHHSDRGSQYTSDAYTALLKDKGILISMCQQVYENTHIERLNSTIKNQYLKHYDISHQGLLNTFLDKAVDAYNNLRYHLSIKISPAQFEHNLKELKIEDRIILSIFTKLKQFGGSKNLNQLNFEL